MSRQAPSARIDMRGFRYELEPLQNRQQWRLDALQVKLGKAQQAATLARVQLEDQQALHDSEAGRAAQGLRSRVDAATHRRTLAYLAQLQTRAQAMRKTLQRLEEERDATQAECLQCQQKLEVLLAHRHDAVQAYQVEALQRQAAEADRDWLARAQWRLNAQTQEAA